MGLTKQQFKKSFIWGLALLGLFFIGRPIQTNAQETVAENKVVTLVEFQETIRDLSTEELKGIKQTLESEDLNEDEELYYNRLVAELSGRNDDVATDVEVKDEDQAQKEARVDSIWNFEIEDEIDKLEAKDELSVYESTYLEILYDDLASQNVDVLLGFVLIIVLVCVTSGIIISRT